MLASQVSITSCTFQSNSGTYGGGVFVFTLSGDVSITSCTFQSNSGTYSGGVFVFTLSGDVSITNCTFQSNSATYGGGVFVYFSSGDVSITNCTFQNNSATDGGGGGVSWYSSSGDLSITNCTFQNNSATDGGGGGVSWYSSSGDLSITNCTFQNNSATDGGGGSVSWYSSSGDLSITNCTFQSNSGAYGGGVTFHDSSGDVSITNCTFQNNSATDGGGGGVSWYFSSGDVSITNCTFQNNSATYTGGGASFHDSSGDLSITSCTFQSNSGTYGGGVFVFTLSGDVSITNCTFQNNSATFRYGSGGGGVLLDSLSGNFSITNCTFQNNSAPRGGGVSLSFSSGDFRIRNCTFQNNSATFMYDSGGGGVSLHSLSGNFSITNCTFQNNSAPRGGGVSLSFSSGDFRIRNCTFQNNSAAFDGGAMYVASTRSVLIDGSIFTYNIAEEGGAAVYATSYDSIKLRHLLPNDSYYLNTTDTDTYSLHILQDVIVEDNHHSFNDYNEMRAGAIYFNRMIVDIFGNSIAGSQFSCNSPLGAIQGANGILQLHGNIKFSNNSGVNGGAISLYNAPLIFSDGCELLFSRNVATGFGGAIYNDGIREKLLRPASDLDMCIVRFSKVCNSCEWEVNSSSMFSITFIGNHAQQGGHSIYATPIYNCDLYTVFLSDGSQGTQYLYHETNLTGHVTTIPLPEDINDTQVLSFPKYVHLCGCGDSNMYNVTNWYQGQVATYPGRTVRLNVTSVDDGNNLSPSVVYTLVDNNDITSPSITLGLTQKAQWIGTVCGMMEYQIYGPEMASFKLLLSNFPSNFPTVVEVKLLSCEPGFTLMSNSSTGVMECSCSKFFTSFGVICDASDGTVTRNEIKWIGVYNSTLPALASYCPMDYCNAAIEVVSSSAW